MWQSRKTWLILLLSVSLLGAYWGVSAQESRNPLAPRPILPPDDDTTKSKPKEKTPLPYAPVIPVGGQYPVGGATPPVLPARKQDVIPPPIAPTPGTLIPLGVPETKGPGPAPQPFGPGLVLPTPPSLPITPEGKDRGPQLAPLAPPVESKQPELIPIAPNGSGPRIVLPETPAQPNQAPVLLEPYKGSLNKTMANPPAQPKVPQVEEKAPSISQPKVPQVEGNPRVMQPAPKPAPPVPLVNQDRKPKAFVLVRPAVKGDGMPSPGPNVVTNNRLTEPPVVCTPNRQQVLNNTLVLPPNRPIVVPNPAMDNALIRPILGGDSGASILLSMQTPQLVVEKRGPAMLRQGEPLHYQIVVRNIGATPANNVRVEDEIPSDTRIVASEPQPTVQGGRAAWTIAAIPPGTERSVSITLQANTFSELANSTTVHVSAAAGARPRAMGGEPLAIRIVGPLTTTIGEQPVFEVRYANQTSQPVTGLMLHGALSEGLSRPEGRLFEGEVGELPANGSKTIKLPVSAVAPGRHVVEMKITAAGGASATAQATIEIQPAAALAPVTNSTSNFVAPPTFPSAAPAIGGVVVRQSPISRLVAGREGDLRIEVTNNTGRPLRNVRIVEALPESLEFAGASDRGMFQSSSRSAHWFLENLAASQSVAVTLRVNPRTAGNYATEIAVQPEGIAETKAASSIVVEGFSDLQVRMIARDNPLETGKETSYEISVSNSGGAAATGVQLEVALPEGLIPREASGPTKHLTRQRQTVLFEKLPLLAPQSQVTYRITAFAHTPGNHRVRVSLASDQSATPLTREQNLLVYDPNR